MRCEGATKSTTFHSPHLLTGEFPGSGDNPITLSRIVDVCTMSPTRHADACGIHKASSCDRRRTIAFSSGNCQLGVSPRATRVACGRLRGRARTIPGTDPIRFDPIPDNGERVLLAWRHRRPQTIGALRQVAIFPGVGSPTPSGCQEIEISSSAFRVRSDTRSAPAEETLTAHLRLSAR